MTSSKQTSDLPLSRLMLGTVQLGMPYGVANAKGQPSYRDSVAIIDAALAGGINAFDTAAGYGESEGVLGRALRELDAMDRVTVVTKVRHLTDAEHADPELASRAITESVETSRQRLGLDCLPVVLFHRDADVRYVEVLDSLCERGWVGRIGFSLRSAPTEPVAFDSRFSAVQVPANLLDGWPRSEAVVASFRETAADVFLRSAYLQGLLVMPIGAIPSHLTAAIPIRRKLARIAADCGITEAELALRYVLGLDVATSILIGVETVEQLRDNLSLAERGPLSADILAELAAATGDVPQHLVNPIGWPELARNDRSDSHHAL